MTKRLAILLGLVFSLGTASAFAEGQNQATTPKTDPVAEAKAKETCTKKGLAGSLLDECIKKELQASAQAGTTTQPVEPKPATN